MKMEIDTQTTTTNKNVLFRVAIALALVGMIALLSGCGSTDTTPEDSQQLTDLAIGTPATISGVTVTVNSVGEGQPSAAGTATLEVNVTYKNESGKSLSISPYDWATVLYTGSDKAHVGGSGSFSTSTVSNGEEWTGIVTLWNDEDPQKVKFESTFLNIGSDNKSVTWLIA